MKSYKQIHLIAYDRGFTYQTIADTPEFNNLDAALTYWKYNKERIEDCNFYKDPIVLIRREIHTTIDRDLSL